MPCWWSVQNHEQIDWGWYLEVEIFISPQRRGKEKKKGKKKSVKSANGPNEFSCTPRRSPAASGTRHARIAFRH